MSAVSGRCEDKFKSTESEALRTKDWKKDDRRARLVELSCLEVQVVSLIARSRPKLEIPRHASEHSLDLKNHKLVHFET